VIGRVPGRPGAPRLGLYAHYDGQPVTPADWTTPPFEPTLVGPDGATVPLPAPGAPVDDEWRLRARAAADDKAPIAALLAALDALGGTEREVELVLCFEGEEESGSPHLGELLLAYADRLAAGAWLICDGPVRQGNAPQVVLGVRGFTDLELTVYGPARELHSGHYGNWAPNPALALARLLASMKDDAGRVTIDGFTADTRPPTGAEQAALDAMPPVEDELLDRLGLAAAEVPGSRLLDRLMLPSLNVRGLRAADVGPAARNVIPPPPPRRSTSGWPPATTRGGCSTGSATTSPSRATWCWTGSRPTPSGARTRPSPASTPGSATRPRGPGRPADRRTPAGAGRPRRRSAGGRAADARRLGPAAPLRAGRSHSRRDPADANPDNNQHDRRRDLRLGNLWYERGTWFARIDHHRPATPSPSTPSHRAKEPRRWPTPATQRPGTGRPRGPVTGRIRPQPSA
jgi:hypothetical protein